MTNATAQADQFLNWAWDTRQDFKWGCHTAIVKEFCSEATVETVQRNPWQERCDHYDDLTKVTFPDGSVAVFNYKGESEN